MDGKMGFAIFNHVREGKSNQTEYSLTQASLDLL